MKLLFALVFVFNSSVGIIQGNEIPSFETENLLVHETWRVIFSCDNACDDKACQLALTENETNELNCNCKSGCKINAQVSVGNNDVNTINEAKNSLLKNAVWKMIQLEIKQKYANAAFQVKSIEVALNHGQKLVFFNCLLLDEKREVNIQVVDMFN